MSVLWSRKEATVLEVQEALRPKKDLSRNTVATILTRLEARGVVSHHKVDKTYYYFPLTSKEEVRESMVSGLVDTLFHGSRTDLVCHVMSEADCDESEIEKVREIIDTHSKRRRR